MFRIFSISFLLELLLMLNGKKLNWIKERPNSKMMAEKRIALFVCYFTYFWIYILKNLQCKAITKLPVFHSYLWELVSDLLSLSEFDCSISTPTDTIWSWCVSLSYRASHLWIHLAKIKNQFVSQTFSLLAFQWPNRNISHVPSGNQEACWWSLDL